MQTDRNMSDLGGLGQTLPLNQINLTVINCNWNDPKAHVFFMVVYSLVFVVGLFLNGFTLKVYFCQAQQQTTSCVTIYLKNLAAADFFMSLCIPTRIMNYASSSITLRQVYCNFGSCAFYLNMYSSILFMGYIAANRYLKIVHPLGTHTLQTVRAAHIISTVTWGFLLATSTTYIILSLVTQETLSSVPSTVTCDALHSKQLSLFYKIIHSCSAAIFLFVLVALIFFYHSTSRRLSLAQQKQLASSGNKKLAKSRRNMLVLVSVFCICFVPYHLVRVPYAFLRGRCSFSHTFFYLKELTIMVSVLNICLDPLIYFIFCKSFRSQLGLRRVFSTTQVTAHGGNTERRSSDGRMSTIKVNRKSSLTTMTKHVGVL